MRTDLSPARAVMASDFPRPESDRYYVPRAWRRPQPEAAAVPSCLLAVSIGAGAILALLVRWLWR